VVLHQTEMEPNKLLPATYNVQLQVPRLIEIVFKYLVPELRHADGQTDTTSP
jgi:hypothetical protein